MSDLRSEEAWEKVWEKSLSLAEKFGIDDCPARPRRARRMPQRFDHADVIVDAAVVTPGETAIEDYRTHVYYATIDVLLEEMNNRFSELNLSLFTALDALLPTSTHFLDMSTLTPFLSHYSIGKTAVESEASLAKNFFLSDVTVTRVLRPILSMKHTISYLKFQNASQRLSNATR